MKSRTGFTLIELLVVVLIIGILGAIALPQYDKAVRRAMASDLKMQLHEVREAAEAYLLLHGNYPTTKEEFEESGISLPNMTENDPFAGKGNVTITVQDYGIVLYHKRCYNNYSMYSPKEALCLISFGTQPNSSDYRLAVGAIVSQEHGNSIVFTKEQCDFYGGKFVQRQFPNCLF